MREVDGPLPGRNTWRLGELEGDIEKLAGQRCGLLDSHDKQFVWPQMIFLVVVVTPLPGRDTWRHSELEGDIEKLAGQWCCFLLAACEGMIPGTDKHINDVL